MLRAYQGYFNKGRFISLDNASIPERKRVIITVLEDELANIKIDFQNHAEQQSVAFKEYFNAIDAIEDELLTEEDYIELENNRLNLRRDLNL